MRVRRLSYSRGVSDKTDNRVEQGLVLAYNLQKPGLSLSVRRIVWLLHQPVERLRERLEPLEVEALLVTHPINMRYLVGFTGDVGLLWSRAMPRTGG